MWTKKTPITMGPSDPNSKKKQTKLPRFVSAAWFAIWEFEHDPESLYCHAYPSGKNRCSRKRTPNSAQLADALDAIRFNSLPFDYGAAFKVSYALLCPLHWDKGMFLSALMIDCASSRPSQDEEATAASASDYDLQLLRVPKDGPPLYKFLQYRNDALLRDATHEEDQLNPGTPREPDVAPKTSPTTTSGCWDALAAESRDRSENPLISTLSAIIALSFGRDGDFRCLAFDAFGRQCDHGLLPQRVATARDLLGADFQTPPLRSHLDEVLRCLLCAEHRNGHWLNSYYHRWAPSFIDDSGKSTSDSGDMDGKGRDLSPIAPSAGSHAAADRQVNAGMDATSDKNHDPLPCTSRSSEVLSSFREPATPSCTKRSGSPAFDPFKTPHNKDGSQHRGGIFSSFLASQRTFPDAPLQEAESRVGILREHGGSFESPANRLGGSSPSGLSEAESFRAWPPTFPGKLFQFETDLPFHPPRRSSLSSGDDQILDAQKQQARPTMRGSKTHLKLVGEHYFFEEPEVERMLSSVEKELLDDIRAIQAGDAVVPRSIRALVVSHRLGRYLEERHFSKASSEGNIDDMSWVQQLEEAAEWSRICELQEAALECRKARLFEAAWNAEVHSTVLRLAFQGKRRKEAGVWYRDITTARITKSYLPPQIAGEDQASGGKMVDYAIIIEPPKDMRGCVRKQARRHGVHSINHTAQEHICHDPIAISIETKRRAIEEDEAEVQLSNWVSAHFTHLRLLSSDYGELSSESIPALPLILIQGDVWRLCIAKSESLHELHIIKYQVIGNTETILGIYKLLASLRRLARWVRHDYWPWFVRHILNQGM